MDLKLRKSRLFIVLLILLPIVSANGLQILIPQGGNINVNKTSSQSTPISLTIQNQEPITFFNITFEQNNHIILSTISSLGSGVNATVTANIISNQDFVGDIKLRGFYQSSTGSGNSQNRNIFLTYNPSNFAYSISECSTTITEDDTITWYNNAGVTLQLFQSPSTPVSGGSINNGTSYVHTFSDPQTFQYYFSISSFPVTPVCTITVLQDSGMVNDPNLDALAHLNVNVLENPTQLNINVPTSIYSILNNANQQGAIIINNVGGETAFEIFLSESTGWFSFSPNNFNLNAGQSQVITYTISPLISNTTQTNQTYVKQVQISGNFNTFIQNFSIFIPYATVFTSGGNFSNGQSIIDVILQFCANNPASSICIAGTTTNTTSYIDPEFNLSIRNSQFLDALRAMVTFKEDFTTGNNFVKEQIASQSSWINETAEKLSSLEGLFKGEQEKREKSSNLFWTIVVIFLSLIVILISGWVIYRQKQKEAREGSTGWSRIQSNQRK